MGSSLHCTPVFNLLIINRNIEAKSKLLLNPLFPILKKGIIQLFIVSLHKVPEFWCSFFFKHKITNFRELLLYYRKKFKQLQNKEWVKQHKIIVPKAVGSSDSKTDWINPIYAELNSCCTETYLVIGSFATEKICKNVIRYIQTRFFHFYLILVKNTQNTTRKTYQFVPQQDFDEEWTDEKLYRKYGLTAEEIAYIEKMIRPME